MTKKTKATWFKADIKTSHGEIRCTVFTNRDVEWVDAKGLHSERLHRSVETMGDAEHELAKMFKVPTLLGSVDLL